VVYLEVGDDHEQEGVRPDPARVGFVEAHLAQIVLEHQGQRPDLLRLDTEFLELETKKKKKKTDDEEEEES
jgi:hypothetical protein